MSTGQKKNKTWCDYFWCIFEFSQDFVFEFSIIYDRMGNTFDDFTHF